MTRSPTLPWILGLWSALLLGIAHGVASEVAWFAVLPLLWALDSVSPRGAFYVGLLTGAGESLVLLGVLNSGWMVYGALVLLYALGRGLFCGLVVWLKPSVAWRAPVWAAAWIALEYMHGMIPGTLPNILGDTQFDTFLGPFASVAGPYGISCLLVWGQVLLWTFVRGSLTRRQVLASAFGWITFIMLMLGGRFVAPGVVASESFSVHVVQGGMPLWLYEKSQTQAHWKMIPRQIYTHLSGAIQESGLVVWPEAPLNEVWGKDAAHEDAIMELASLFDALWAGSYRFLPGEGLLNGAVFLSENAPSWVYKQRLVPNVESFMVPGKGAGFVMFQGHRLGALFCLESSLPTYAHELVREHGVEALVVFADASRFGHTDVGRLHRQRAMMRAYETQRAVVHASQSGHTAVAYPDGRWSEVLKPFQASVLSVEIPLVRGQTMFTRFPYGLLVVALGVLSMVGLRRRWAE